MAGVNITAAQVYLLNHMNSIASRVGLGDLIKNAETPGNQALASAHILVGDSGGTAQDVPMTGDVTISNAGATTIGAGKLTVAKADPALAIEATGTLTQANLQAMFGAAVNLIPAPGLGKFIWVQFMELFHLYSTTVYAGGGVVSIQYTGSTVLTEFAKTVITGGASASFYQRPTLYDLDNSTGTGSGLSVAALANLGVEITNASGALTGGNVANVLKWRVRYKVMTLLT